VGNLVLHNPSGPNETQAALVTAVKEDEAILAGLAGSVPTTVLANEVLAGPASGAAAASGPRALVAADLPSILVPTLIYSVAGTPLPAASSALEGARAVVSDATLPTYLGAYLGGGAVVCPVFCNGTAWVTG
jgi:hypothetical protein